MINFVDTGDKQYKANLHCHSNCSDGTLKPEQIIKGYKAHGYSILAITDHECPIRHSDLSTKDFLVLDGYEAYIRPSKFCIYNKYKKEIHLNLIAKSKETQFSSGTNNGYMPYIAYNFFCCKYFNRKKARNLCDVPFSRIRRFTIKYLNKFIRMANDNGYFVFLNHPYWSMMECEEINQLKGIHSMEIFNSGCMEISDSEGDIKFYDSMLRSGNKVYCHGSDDGHNPGADSEDDMEDDSFGAWTYIIADDLTYNSVVEAIDKGKYYASTGPMIKKLIIDKRHIEIETTPCSRITVHVTPKYAKWKSSTEDEMTKAEFDLPLTCNSFYISVRDSKYKRAVTHSFDVKGIKI